MDSTIRCPRCNQEIDAEGPACPACGHIHTGRLSCEHHPDRSAIGVCVVCGVPLCEDCNRTDDIHYACERHSEIPVTEGWAQIYSTSDEVEADLIRENLQSEGVDAAVLSQKDRSFGVVLGDLSPVRVLVPAYAYLDGMKLLAQHMDGRGEVIFACPTCGEAFEAGEARCSACGTPLPTPAS